MWYGFCDGAFNLSRFHYIPGGGLTLLIGIVLAAIIVYLLIRNGKSKSAASESAEAILKERLAKGDITEEEYSKLLKKLKK